MRSEYLTAVRHPRSGARRGLYSNRLAGAALQKMSSAGQGIRTEEPGTAALCRLAVASRIYKHTGKEMLIKLPNGNWIDASTIRAIRVLPAIEGADERVTVVTDSHLYIVTPHDCFAYADALAAQVNAACSRSPIDIEPPLKAD